MALVLAFSVGSAIAIAQVVREMPAVGATNAKVFVVATPQDIELTEDQEAQADAIRKEYRPTNEEDAKEALEY